MRKHLCAIILVLAGAAVPAAAALRPVVIVPVQGSRQIWLSAPGSISQTHAARNEYRLFIQTWRRFFGHPPDLPSIINVPAEDGEGQPGAPLFHALWNASSPSLPAGEHRAAEEAFRVLVLGETGPRTEALRHTLAQGRLLPAAGAEMLWYLFLNQEAADSSVLPRLLPPGRRGGKLMNAVRSDEGKRLLQNRMAVWVLQHAAAAHLLPKTDETDAPAVWVVARDLTPGSFTLCKIKIPSWAGSLRGEAAGDLQGSKLRLLSLFTDAEGNALLSGVGTLTRPNLLFPAASATLWLVLWNPPGAKESGYGLSLTFWSEASPPFTVLKSSGGPESRSVLIQEAPGMAGFDLWGRGSKDRHFRRLPLPSIPDRGPGTHLYHFMFASKDGALELKLRGMTWSGGTYRVPLPNEETSNTP
jgi:hypothetical protein